MRSDDEPPRTARDWLVAAGTGLLGYLVVVVLLRIWAPWPDAFRYALIGPVSWVVVDAVDDIRRRRRRASNRTAVQGPGDDVTGTAGHGFAGGRGD